jgi:peroxiredoxin
MKLLAPCQGIDFQTEDVFGNPFQLSDLLGKRIVLSFFRDAACPFCNYRLFELTQQHKALQASGVEIIVVFSDAAEQVKKYLAKRPRPFTMICDPELELYNKYGVQKSTSALFKAIFLDFPEIFRGFINGGRPSNNPHVTLVPADFLLDTDGRVVQTYYGKTTADHIPLENIKAFAKSNQKSNSARLESEVIRLTRENQKLRAGTSQPTQ